MEAQLSGSPHRLGKAAAAADDGKPKQTLLPNDEGNLLRLMLLLRSPFGGGLGQQCIWWRSRFLPQPDGPSDLWHIAADSDIGNS